MNRDLDFDGTIRSIIHEELRYLRHYQGQVVNNNDPDNNGRVKVIIPKIGWFNEGLSQWAVPRGNHSLDVPKVGEWVEVYFVDGDVDQPAYFGIATEMKDMKPKQFNNIKIHILWQSSIVDDQYVKYDDDNKKLIESFENIELNLSGDYDINADGDMTINANSITINDGTESAVLGDALNNWITNTLLTWLNNLTLPVSGATAGPPTTPVTGPSNYLSSDVKLK